MTCSSTAARRTSIVPTHVGVNRYKEGVSFWVRLREPVLLRSVLAEMEEVAQVEDVVSNGSGEPERRLDIWLRDTQTEELV